MSFGEQMKNKADEVHLQAKAKDFGDALAEMVKTAVSAVAGYAQENREKVDGALDKAEARIEERTNGKHSETVGKVRAGLDKGIDKLVEKHRTDDVPGAAAGTAPTPGTSVPAPGAPAVPDDTFSAFDEDATKGSPS